MESTSANSLSTTTSHHRPTPLLFDKVLTDVPPLPQLEHHQSEHVSPASTPSPTTTSPASLMFPDFVGDDAIVVDSSAHDGDHHHHHHHEGSNSAEDDAARSPAPLDLFPTSPSLGGEQVPVSSPGKPTPGPLQRSLSQLSTLSLSTRSLSQHQQQSLPSPGLLSPSFAAMQTQSRKPTDSPEVDAPQPPVQPTVALDISNSTSVPSRDGSKTSPPSADPSAPQPDIIVRSSPSDAAGDEHDENEVEDALNRTLTTSRPTSVEKAVEAPLSEEMAMSTAEALATLGLDEGISKDEGRPDDEHVEAVATPKGKGKQKEKAGPASVAGSDAGTGPRQTSESASKPFKFNGSRLARKAGQQPFSRQSYASPDPFYNPNSTTNVYINGLPPFFTHEQLTRLASEFGKVLSSRVFHRFSQIKPNGSGQQQGSTYAFVLYETVEDASRCITSLRKYSDLHPSFARTQRLPSGRPHQPTTAEGLLDKNRPEYRGSPEAPDLDAPQALPNNNSTVRSQHPSSNYAEQHQRPAQQDEVDVLIQGLPTNTTAENVKSLIGDRIVPLNISLLPIGTEQKREGRQIAYVRFGSRKDASDVISKLHMTRVLGFGNSDRSTVPPTLQVVEISPVAPHDSTNHQDPDLPYDSPSPPRTAANGGRLLAQGLQYPSVRLEQWSVPQQHHRVRSSSGGTDFSQQQPPSVFDAHPLLASQLFPQAPMQLPSSVSMPLPNTGARSSAALLNHNQPGQRFGATQPGFANLGMGLPTQLQQLQQQGVPFMPPQDQNALNMGTISDLAPGGGRRAVSMPFPQVAPALPSGAANVWPPLSVSVSAAPQGRPRAPPSPPRTTTNNNAGPSVPSIRPFVPSAAAATMTNFHQGSAPPPRTFPAGHLQVGQNSIPLTVNQQAAQAYSARFRQRVQQQQQHQQQAPPEVVQPPSVWSTARNDGAESGWLDDLAPQVPQPPPTQNVTPAPSRRRAFRRQAAANQ